MDQERTIKKIMVLEVKPDPDFPEWCYNKLRRLLSLAWAAGYDERPKEHANARRRPVVRIDLIGHEKIYPSILEASRQVKCSDATIIKAIKHKWRTHHGKYEWRYLVEGVTDTREEKDIFLGEVVSKAYIKILPSVDSSGH